ncbi:MAG: hypothetical protein M3509_03665, partial [Chloroflexota bacterium]|nr:hypothetical protein [Chloroflexota bacterium]
MRTPNRRSRSRGHAWFHTLTAFLLLVSVLAPLAQIGPAAAQQGNQPPPLPAPSQVAIAGSFQTALGCAGDYDPSCAETQLTDAGGGSWGGVFAIPPGNYGLLVVATSDQQRWLGEGGIPDGNEIPLNVPDNAAGVYVGYDAVTGEITIEPVANQVVLVTDLGQTFAMAPAGQGGYEVFFDAEPGNYGFQVLADGQPIAQDAISLDSPFRVQVAIDNQGNIASLDTVDDTTLAVTKLGPDNAPLPGACFAVETGNGRFIGQACDGDDGAADGLTEIRFPNGLDRDQYVLAEVTPGDAAPATDQPVELGRGETAVTVSLGAAEEPAQTDEPDEPSIDPTDD